MIGMYFCKECASDIKNNNYNALGFAFSKLRQRAGGATEVALWSDQETLLTISWRRLFTTMMMNCCPPAGNSA